MNLSRWWSFLPFTLLTASMALPSYAVEFPETTDRGSPERSAGLGSRGFCPLTALLPHNSLATTFAADPALAPALFFEIPGIGISDAELVIEDSRGQQVYQQSVDLPDSPGVIQVTLPKAQASGVPLFEAGEIYYWDFAITCGDSDWAMTHTVVSGGLQRVEPDADLLAKLSEANGDPLAQAEIYAANQAWQETIALAAQLRDENPQVWTELMQSVGLESAMESPMVGIVAAE